MLPRNIQTDGGPRHVVIMGCGQIGAMVATTLSEAGHTLHILDLDPVAFDLLPPGMVAYGHIVPIVGDGTLEEDLRKASIQDAGIFIAVAGRDATNALAAQIARHLLQVPRVICRIDDPTRKEMYGRLGLIAVSATTLAAEMVLESTGS